MNASGPPSGASASVSNRTDRSPSAPRGARSSVRASRGLGLVAAGRGRVPPAGVGRVDVDGHEDVALSRRQCGPPVPQRDQRCPERVSTARTPRRPSSAAISRATASVTSFSRRNLRPPIGPPSRRPGRRARRRCHDAVGAHRRGRGAAATGGGAAGRAVPPAGPRDVDTEPGGEQPRQELHHELQRDEEGVPRGVRRVRQDVQCIRVAEVGGVEDEVEALPGNPEDGRAATGRPLSMLRTCASSATRNAGARAPCGLQRAAGPAARSPSAPPARQRAARHPTA